MNNIAPEGDPLYNFADNTKYRGTWDVWLRDTVAATEIWHLKAVCKSIRNFTLRAKCLTCRQHSFEYVSCNPPEDHICKKESLFMYLVRFMNTIQKRKHKKFYDPDILYRVYVDEDTEVCLESDCEKHHTNNQTNSHNDNDYYQNRHMKTYSNTSTPTYTRQSGGMVSVRRGNFK